MSPSPVISRQRPTTSEPSNDARISIRRLGAGDRAGFQSLFGRLSATSRLRRFFSPKPRLTSRELTYLTDIDHHLHEALAAVDRCDGSIVGTARYVRDAEQPNVAEVAIEVADELQGMSVGTTLAGRTIDLARANGVTLLTATTMWDNHGARALLRRYSFHPVGRSGGELAFERVLEP